MRTSTAASIVLLSIACTPVPAADAGALDGAGRGVDTGAADDGGAPDATGTEVDASLPAFDCMQDPFGETFGPGVISTLADPAWEGRRFDSNGLRLAVAWTAHQFECIGVTPGAPGLTGRDPDSMTQELTTHPVALEPDTTIYGWTFDESMEYRFDNVIGSIPGRGALAGEVIVVGAHIDALGRIGPGTDEVVHGANDDASGVAAVLALARDLVSHPGSGDRRTIVFAVWGVEEEPFYRRGSASFLEGLTDTARDRIMYYVNFDMVGSYDVDHMLTVTGAYPAAPPYEASAARTLVEGIGGHSLDIDYAHSASDSDAISFCHFSIPYVFFHTGDMPADGGCYHSSCDDPARIDVAHMQEILRLASQLTVGLAESADLAPTRRDFVAAHAATPDWNDCMTAP